MWWNNENGWGFAYGEDGREYFLGRRSLVDVDELESGDKIEFESDRNVHGLAATGIHLTQKTDKDYDGFWSPTRDGGCQPSGGRSLLDALVEAKKECDQSICCY
jgi:cold shock CspA family protein